MTARSIRRAAERKAQKLARRAETNRVGQVANLQADCQSALISDLDTSPEFSNFRHTISDAQLAANRANAQLSTGAKSDDGKAKSCLNAVKTGLTGRTVLLHTDDAAEYQRHIDAYEKEFQPVGQRERDLVQSIADTQWRLLRIPSLESGIYALGHLEFANSLDEQDSALRPGMIEVKTFLKYEKQLRNLQLQESRLARRREKEIVELRELQQTRRAEEHEDVGQALSPVRGLWTNDQEALSSVNPHLLRPANGFEFSNPLIGRCLPDSSAQPSPKLSAEAA